MKLATIFQSGMVLQRDLPIKMWGTAKPGTEVTVNGQKTISSEIGEWEITLPAMEAGGPHDFQVGDITLNDVLIGDVWLCSGQSNMELSMARVKRAFPGEVENTVNDTIRQFHVPVTYNFEGPQSEIPGQGWISVNPEQTDAFSAVGYFFAKKVQSQVGVPIGIILSAAGGTPIETWLSEESLQKFPAHLGDLAAVRQEGHIQSVQEADSARNGKWYSDLDRFDLGLHEQWMAPEFDSSGWETIGLDEDWKHYPSLQSPGAVWLRKEFHLPQGSGKIDLGTVTDADFVYVNGELVGTTGYQYPPRIYPTNFVEGRNVVAVRVIANSGPGGFTFGKDRHLMVNDEKISLEGDWHVKRGVTMPALSGTTFFQNKPTGCFNAMIAPLLRFGIKGALWYQGESNAGNPDGYGERLIELATDWRQRFGIGEFPFIGVQLANWSHQGLNWSWLRQEQSQLLKLSNAGMAVAVDAGEANDLHPLDKKTVGERLALQALRIAYGKDVVASGPKPLAVVREGDALVVEFDGELEGAADTFEIEVGDVTIPVNATLKGKTAYLTGVAIERAEFVKHAWSSSPTGHLYGAGGLPVAPFRLEA